MQYFSADWIFPVHAEPLQNAVLVMDNQGTVESLMPIGNSGIEKSNIRFYNGILCPGFVNTHNHLELSWAEGLIEENRGLHYFISRLEEVRNSINPEILQEAVNSTFAAMEHNGIVATADISNGLKTRDLKSNSSHYFHTFIEIFGSHPDRADEIFRRALEMKEAFSPSSITPHATYSLSDRLFEKISAYNQENKSILSIHHQETQDENLFFMDGSGSIAQRRKIFTPDLPDFKGNGKRPIEHVWRYLRFASKILLVHNTFTSLQDVDFIKTHLPQAVFCLCPHANLYIENRLPQVDMLWKSGIPLTLGTDSLASNHQISILEEIKAIHSHFPAIPLQEVIRWATLNGAEFLGINQRFGSFEKGKKPAIVHISHADNKTITKQSRATRITAQL